MPPVGDESVEVLYARFGPAYRWLVTGTGMVASFTMVLTGTIVAVAVPHVMGAYGVGQDTAQLLTTAYIVAMTTSQLLNAWFVGRFGQRRTFVLILLLFFAGGLIASLGPTLDFIIAGRIIQGFASGVIQPLVMVTVFQVFPPDRRGMAMGIYTIGLILALGLGPVVGGITIDLLSWRHIFFISLPLVAVAFFLGLVFMPQERPRGPFPKFDVPGYVSLTVCLFCVMSVLSTALRLGWTSDAILGQIVLGLAAGLFFLISQMRPGSTLLDLTLLRNPAFASAICIAVVFGAGNFASTYAIPVFGQLIQGQSATAAGALLLPASLLVVILLPLTGRTSDLVSSHIPIMGGLLCFAAGVFLLSGADANTPYWALVLFAGISRFGMAWINPALMTAALSALPASQLNKAGGTMNFFRQLGGATGTGVIVLVLESRAQVYSEALTATQTPDNAISRHLLASVRLLLDAEGLPDSQIRLTALHYLGRVVHAQATTFSFQDGFIVLGILFIVALFPAWLLSRTQRG